MNEGLNRLDACLAGNRIDQAKNALFALSPKERAILEQELGSEIVHRIYTTARRRTRGKQGRVVLINGIMGAKLDVIRRRDRDNVWLNYWRLLQGRISDLRLAADGATQADPAVRVEVSGLHRKTYLAMAMELATRWDCLQFGFDWRLDIRVSAKRLAAAVEEWAGGQPAHIVAHSMGGLVARAFAQRFPTIWAGLADTGLRKGGRLVMLGTPNRGSYAIPRMMTGEEKIVRQLATLDVSHKLPALLDVIGTFPGSFQMLPSRLVDLPDDHARLFDPRAWGNCPVSKRHLASAAKFHDELHPILTPERLVYVAGYDQETPHRIRIEAPGEFSYQTTRAGDGRVPHELGLLEKVPTQWIREAHGDLPRNPEVLAGIHEILVTGETATLETTPPPRRRSSFEGQWRSSRELEPDDEDLAELKGLVERVRRTRRRKTEPPPSEESARIIALVGEEFLGSAPRQGGASNSAARRGAPTKSSTKLNVEVVWGDITRTPGDIYCAGHYRGVLPQYAERALDTVVSFERDLRRGIAEGASADLSRYVLRNLTERGVLRGDLGEIMLFPWAGEQDRGKSVAIAGMGFPGSFTVQGLEQLAESLTYTVADLPGKKTICTVLIGSGEGGLSVRESVLGLVCGMTNAVREGSRGNVALLRIVEKSYVRSRRIHEALRSLVSSDNEASKARRSRTAPGTLSLKVAPRCRRVPGGDVTYELTPENASKKRTRATSLEPLLQIAPTRAGKQSLRKVLGPVAARRLTLDGRVLGMRLAALTDDRGGRGIPARISFVRNGRGIRVAAINDTAVVPERDLGIDFALIEELSERTTDPPVADLVALATSLHRRLLPVDFRDHVSIPSPKIFEIDRDTAIVHWELLAVGREAGPEVDRPFLGLRHPVARQLRTAYSGKPEPANRPPGPLRALVIGDPGDPDRGEDLSGAREEAERVVRILRGRGVETHSRIGAPRGRSARWGREGGPASRLELLSLLDRQAFDILHYSGHGDFDPQDPTRTGWVFKDGLFTAADLETAGAIPRLVVANACLSSRTSRALRGGARLDTRSGDVGLLPSLADEFLRRGVRNYVGTAWEVSDEGAILFAETLYAEALPAPGSAGATLGDALLAARRRLDEKVDSYGALWLAYQHYGDPGFRLEGTDALGTGYS